MTVFEEMSNMWRKRGEGLRVERSGLARREARWGFAFIAPWIIGFSLFYALPMVASLVFSFTRYYIDRPEPMSFIGFENYLQIFRDPSVADALFVTLRFMIITLPVGVIQPVLMAALLNAKKLWLKRIFRTLYFMPSIVPVVSTTYIWRGFLNTETGWLNLFLENVLGFSYGPEWLNSTTWIYPALLLVGLWGAGNAMLYTLAGMQNVPTELYEAARVDGAGPMRVFLNVTLPMITPVIFYNMILMVIGLFQYFTIAWILGGPNSNPSGATLFYNVYLYKQAFVYSNMGYGSTLAWLLFAIAMTVTAILFVTAKYWVYYAGESR